jgi:hypothetical protein
MSILISLEAMPNRVKALAEVIGFEGSLTQEDAVRRFIPGVDNTEQFRALLRECIRMSIISDDKTTKTLRLVKDIPLKEIRDPEKFIGHCIARLIPKEKSGENGNEAFPRALTWLLTRAIGPNLESGSEFKEPLLKDLEGTDIYELTNASRSSMLMYWAQALGFAEWITLNGNTFCNPDPTRAMASILKEILEKKHQTPIAYFFEKLGREIPVFETGHIRREVEARLKNPRGEEYISQATSLALQRLDLKGCLKIDRLADSPVMLMVGLDQKDTPISHITLLKA